MKCLLRVATELRYYGANATSNLNGPRLFWRDATRQYLIETTIFTLSQLHAELAGKFAENRNAGVKIKTAMMQVEAVLQMLRPDFDIRSISAKRRNKSNPWFKRGTLLGARWTCCGGLALR